jgi:hypothetical protein
MITLYKKDTNGNVLEWNIDIDNDADYPTLLTSTGRFNGKHNTFITAVSMTNSDIEIKSRVKIKKSDGWLTLEDLKMTHVNEKELKIRLPHKLKDLSDRYKPQKAIGFKQDYFIYPAFIQRKINGVRCTIAWETITRNEGLFAETYEGAVIRSKEGHEYVLPHITNSFTKDCFTFDDKELIYDGELYMHNKTLNYIRASIPIVNDRGTISKTTNPPERVQFWTFDLSISNTSQLERTKILESVYNKYFLGIGIVRLVKSQLVYSDKEALEYADMYIDEGFEGGILRNLDAEYAFGKRSSNMMKLKKWYYTKCTILDIILKNVVTVNNTDRTYISVLLKNDVNSETFECTPEGNEDYRIELLNTKDNLIGKLANIKFRERSGIKKVPFQSILINIIE